MRRRKIDIKPIDPAPRLNPAIDQRRRQRGNHQIGRSSRGKSDIVARGRYDELPGEHGPAAHM